MADVITTEPASHEVDLTRSALTWLLVAASAYVACSLMANVMSVRILRLGPDWASFSIDAGTLTYPLTFTLRDLVHKIGGRWAARVVILSGAAFNIVLAVGLWAAAVAGSLRTDCSNPPRKQQRGAQPKRLTPAARTFRARKKNSHRQSWAAGIIRPPSLPRPPP